MNIRGHHLLCIRYFKGKGYSEDFVLNFFKVINTLELSTLIKVVNYPDIICEPCPHKVDGKCIKKGPDFESEVRKKDEIVMKYLKIRPNHEIKVIDVQERVNKKLGKVREICEDCEWLRYCQ